MVLKVELGNLFDDVVVCVFGVHRQAICSPLYLVGIQLVFIVVLVAGCEPVFVVRWVPLAAIITVFIFRLFHFFWGCRRSNLLVIGLQREVFHVQLLP